MFSQLPHWEFVDVWQHSGEAALMLKFSLSCMQDFHRIGPLGRFDLVVAMSVYLFVPFHVVYFEAYFAPTSRSQMSKLFRDPESLGKSAGKKWFQS